MLSRLTRPAYQWARILCLTGPEYPWQVWKASWIPEFPQQTEKAAHWAGLLPSLPCWHRPHLKLDSISLCCFRCWAATLYALRHPSVPWFHPGCWVHSLYDTGHRSTSWLLCSLPRHQRARLEFAIGHQNWQVCQWCPVLYVILQRTLGRKKCCARQR